MFKKRLIAVLISFALVTPSHQAFAMCCGDGAVVVGGLAPGITATAASTATLTSAVVAAISAATALVPIAALFFQEHFGGLSGNIELSAKMNAFAITSALDAQKNLLIMAMAASEKSRILGEQSLTTLPMADQTIASAVSAERGIIGAGKVSSMGNISLLSQQIIKKSATGNVLDSYQNYAANYANEDKGLPNADILANSLLAGASLKGGVENLTFSPAQMKAATDFISNAVDVSPPQDISDSAANTVEGRRFRMLLRAEKARMSMAFKSFADALAYRTPIPDFDGGMKKATPISYQEFLTNEVRRRYNNPTWYAQVAGASPTNLQREDLYMKALDIHLRMEDSRRLEKIELLLAQLNLNQIANGPLRAQIEQQRSRVNPSAK